jgi:hypothetical protein
VLCETSQRNTRESRSRSVTSSRGPRTWVYRVSSRVFHIHLPLLRIPRCTFGPNISLPMASIYSPRRKYFLHTSLLQWGEILCMLIYRLIYNVLTKIISKIDYNERLTWNIISRSICQCTKIWIQNLDQAFRLFLKIIINLEWTLKQE